jgi:hypothetical protein
MRGSPASQHPIDQLIRGLIQSGRQADEQEVRQVLDRLAAVPFDPLTRSVRSRHRGLSYQGLALGDRAPSLDYHLVQRVIVDRQWTVGTTAAEYVADLRNAVRHPASHLAVYERRGGHVAIVLAATEAILVPMRRGPLWLPELLVTYSADRGIIVTGYQVSSRAAASIPLGARWLK